MKLPPLWKIRRELTRPLTRLAELPESVFTRLFGSLYYDRFLSGQMKCSDGTVPLTNKVAVYLIFPSQGVVDSHVVALRYLQSHGYAPLVVSNLRLSDTDRQKLLDHSWLCIERPNFGYDFGGYRDGILTVMARAPDTERLVLVNDSCWFPLPGAADWLAHAEAMDRDLAAAATSYGHPRVDVAEYRRIEWDYRPAHPKFHYCSFALMLSGRLLRDCGFHAFWKSIPLSNSKRLAVRRGEIGLTQWIKAHDYTHATTHDISDLDRTLADLDDDALEAVARDLIIKESPQILALKRNLMAHHRDRRDLEALILTTVAHEGSSYALTPFLHQHAGYAFLKKSPVWLDPEASDLTIAFAQGLDGAFGQTIAKEAIDLRVARAPSFAPVDG